MPTIEVHCLLRYCTDVNIRREAREWQAHHGVRIVKGNTLNGTFNFWITGRGGISINARNSDLFLEEVCYRSALRIREQFGKDVCIVPIPNSGALASSRNTFQTYILAKKIAAILGHPCTSSDLLRWQTVVGMAHKNERSRSAAAHKAALRVMRTTDQPIVLFDDVVTSGSQMLGSKLALEEAGMKVAGMISIFEVVNQGIRSDDPGWRVTTRRPWLDGDQFDFSDAV
ncbi:phosphoribosyltransferase [Rhizobium herbae]|uniref:Phosphoribosyltransferase n=1 Tax=Rhizobium herbae TaxID=508661 RepID=A0ABS4EFZ6_9HYPH|nr:phosphoribosyltransferase [Rhizobium herbae]MBP1856868.1 hypothetical protein [Rhizobium herbae]